MLFAEPLIEMYGQKEHSKGTTWQLQKSKKKIQGRMNVKRKGRNLNLKDNKN